MPNAEVTFIDEDGIYVCNNCGAHAVSPGEIQHFGSCSPGESERWKKIYSEVAEEEAAWLEKSQDEVACLEAEKTEEAWWKKYYNTMLD